MGEGGGELPWVRVKVLLTEGRLRGGGEGVVD